MSPGDYVRLTGQALADLERREDADRLQMVGGRVVAVRVEQRRREAIVHFPRAHMCLGWLRQSDLVLL